MEHRKPQKNPLYLYGLHAVRAALANPHRKINNILLALPKGHAYRRILEDDLTQHPNPPHVSETARGHIEKLVGKTAVHQDIVAFVKPLPNHDIASFLNGFEGELPDVAMLDHVTDPHNIGAVLRSAAAFGIGALITSTRNSPTESGLIGRIASGGLDVVPWLRARNLSQACETLNEAGYQIIGLAGEGQQELSPEAFKKGRPHAFIFGSEGDGIRPKIQTYCHNLLKLPTQPPILDLNVSNAAAVTFFALRQS